MYVQKKETTEAMLAARKKEKGKEGCVRATPYLPLLDG